MPGIVGADESVDAIVAIAVPTAVADLSAAILSAKVAKPVAVALLNQADTVRLMLPEPGHGQTGHLIPAYAYPESAVCSSVMRRGTCTGGIASAAHCRSCPD